MRYDLADVFTSRPLAGNQLAVFADNGTPSDDRLIQATALEMNLSETVFLTAAKDGGDARVRMFSTVTEVPFAGHPLLGTAAILAHHRKQDEAALHIETNAGIVAVSVHHQDMGRYTAWMDQPIPRFSPVPAEQAAQLLAVLGLARGELPVTLYDAGIPHLYVMADSAESVRNIEPDFPALGRAAGPGRARINVFALTGPAAGVTRMFSPFDRVPEDPACGSAAGPLAAHLVRATSSSPPGPRLPSARARPSAGPPPCTPWRKPTGTRSTRSGSAAVSVSSVRASWPGSQSARRSDPGKSL